MSILRETYIEGKVCAYARRQGFLALKFEPDSSAGWPDRIFLGYDGSCFFIEFKQPGKKVRPLQEHRIEILRGRGYQVYVIDDVDEGCHVIDIHTP